MLIGEMKDGNKCYTLPWAVCIIGEDYYIHPYYHYYISPSGTVQMFIEKNDGKIFFKPIREVSGNGFAFPRMREEELIRVYRIE